MKIITVPGDLTVKFETREGERSEVIPFKKMLVHQMDSYEAVKTRAQIRQANKIVDLVEAANGTLALEDADYAVLDDACKELRYIPKINRQLLPYIDAIERAESVSK